MKKFENLYAGLIEKKLVGGIDWDLLDKQACLDIYADDGTRVGYISIDALRFAVEERATRSQNGKAGVQ